MPREATLTIRDAPALINAIEDLIRTVSEGRYVEDSKWERFENLRSRLIGELCSNEPMARGAVVTATCPGDDDPHEHIRASSGSLRRRWWCKSRSTLSAWYDLDDITIGETSKLPKKDLLAQLGGAASNVHTIRPVVYCSWASCAVCYPWR